MNAPRRPNREPSPTSPSSPSQAARQLLDALVQSSAVELFQSRQIAVAPLPPAIGHAQQRTYNSLAGIVALTGPRSGGSLSLSWPDPVFSLFTPPVPPSSRSARDLLRELTNQLAGRLKNRLLNFAVSLSVGVPSILSGQALERQREGRDTEVVYFFRTLRGQVAVTLDLALDHGTLNYAGANRVAKEGDFIPF